MKKSTTTTTTTTTNTTTTTTDTSHPRPPSFEIRVALVGYVSVGKSTVLNALLGDKFSEVSLRRTTAGINFFRIYQNNKDSNKKTSTSTKDTVASINDDNEKTTTTTTTTNTTEAVWNQSRFIEDFGMEKVKLEELLSMFRMVFTSIFGLSIDGGEAMVGSSTYYVQAYKDAIKQYGKDDAIMKVMMPHTLTDPSHWGYFAWKYIKLCDGKNLVGPVSEFGENADAKPVELASSDISKDVDVKPMEE